MAKGKFVQPNSNGFQFRAGLLQDALDKWNARRMELIKLDTEGASNEQKYLSSLRDLDYGHGQAIRKNLTSAAARGLARSSGYAKAVTDEATGFNRTLGDLNTQRKTYLNSDLSQRNAINTGFNDYLRQLSLQQQQFDYLNGRPSGRTSFTQFKIGAPKQNFTTPNTNSFFAQMRKKYGF